MSQAEKELSDLDLKILRDFHFHAPEINEDVKGELPSITDKAKLFITNNLSTDSSFFRFGVTGGGCSGFNYLMDEDTSQNEDDILFCNFPKAIIDKESLKYLYGAVIDLAKQGVGSNLVVDNPGAKMSCGCGTSFNFDFGMWNDNP